MRRLTRVEIAVAIDTALLAVQLAIITSKGPTWAWVALIAVQICVFLVAWFLPTPQAHIVVHEPTYETRVMATLPGPPGIAPTTASLITGTTVVHAARAWSAYGPEPTEEADIPTGRFAYLSVSNEGDADSPPVAPYLEFTTVTGQEIATNVHARWPGNDYPDFIVLPERDRTKVIPHGTKERFFLDTVYVASGESLCRIYDHAVSRTVINDSEFNMRLCLRYGEREDSYDYVVRATRQGPEIERVSGGGRREG